MLTLCTLTDSVKSAFGSPGVPQWRPRGKAVRNRRDPVTVIGDETRRPSPLARGAGKGAGSRTIRESGDLPGTRALRTGLRGEARVAARVVAQPETLL